jgi:Protein of unknown function (DUF3667)
MITCKNCAAEFDGKFCPSCGQKSKTARITFRQVLKDVRDQFVHFDRGFLFTIRELTLRPGHTIRDYLDGKRVQHVKPVKFMVWATAIGFLVTNLLGFQKNLLDRLEKEQGSTVKTHEFGQKLMSIITEHPNILMLLILPAVAFSAWVLFWKKRLNYAEHFTANAFLMGQLSILGILTNIGYLFWKDINVSMLAAIGTIQWLVWGLYFGWAYSQFFQQPRKIGLWLKGALVLILGYMFMILVVGLIVVTALALFRPQLEALFSN